MFMGKSELDNMTKLLKLRMRDCRGFYTIVTLLIVSFIPSVIDMLKVVFTFQLDPQLISAPTHPNWALFYMVIAGIYYTFQYDEFNEKYQIYPQTNSSRFLSFELYLYFIHITTQAIALGFNLLQYLIFFLIRQKNDNLAFVYTMNPMFVITGFFTYLLYGAILISFIIFIFTIVRKTRWRAFIAFIAILLILWLTRDMNIPKNIVDFYLMETSVTVFFFKTIVTWLLLEAINYVINSHTNITMVRKFNYGNIVLTSIFLLTFLINIFTTTQDTQHITQNFITKEIDTSKDDPYRSIDVSSLPSGSTLKACFDFRQVSDYQEKFFESVYNTSDSNVYIYFIPEKFISNGINLTAFLHPRLEVKLKDQTLYLRTIHDPNVKVLDMYPYSTLMRFDCFKDKPFASKYSDNSSGNVPGSITITTPKSKKLKVIESMY